MGLVWNPLALPSLVAGLVALLAAAFVTSVGAGRRTNRLLATVLAFYGLAFGAIWLLYSVDDPREAFASQVVANVLFYPAISLYLAFIGSALTTAPRFLRSRAWIAGSALFAGVMSLLSIVRSDLAVVGIVEPPYAPYEAVPGPLQLAYFALALAGSLLGLTLSIREFARMPRGSPTRRRAGIFLVAFGIQDGLIATMVPLVSVLTPDHPLFITASVAGLPLSIIASSILVAYGMLRYQLFDIDVKIKLGVKRTTLAAAFLAVVFVVGQLVQAVAGILFGAIAGAIAAGLLLFALAPLQRLAERVSDAAMPRVRDTEEYRTVRKREVYLAAVESAMDDGEITDRERNVLATLADQLGLGVKETVEIEREAKGARAKAA